MFNVHHKDTSRIPTVFTNLFTRNYEVHSHGTRLSSKFHVPIAKTEFMKRAISVKGVNIWNRLSQSVNYECSLLSFKIALKKYVTDNPTIVNYIN